MVIELEVMEISCERYVIGGLLEGHVLSGLDGLDVRVVRTACEFVPCRLGVVTVDSQRVLLSVQMGTVDGQDVV